jgi:hypothetical protein
MVWRVRSIPIEGSEFVGLLVDEREVEASVHRGYAAGAGKRAVEVIHADLQKDASL